MKRNELVKHFIIKRCLGTIARSYLKRRLVTL